MIGHTSVLNYARRSQPSDTNINLNNGWIHPNIGSRQEYYHYNDSYDFSDDWGNKRNAGLITTIGIPILKGHDSKPNPSSSNALASDDHSVINNYQNHLRVSASSSEKKHTTIKYHDFGQAVIGEYVEKREWENTSTGSSRHSHAGSESLIIKSPTNADGEFSTRRVNIVNKSLGTTSTLNERKAERYYDSSLVESLTRKPHHSHPKTDCGYDCNMDELKSIAIIGSTEFPVSLSGTININRGDVISSKETWNKDEGSPFVTITNKSLDRKRTVDVLTGNSLLSSPYRDLSQHITRSTFPAKRTLKTRRVSLPSCPSYPKTDREGKGSFSGFGNEMVNPFLSWNGFSIIDQHHRQPRRMSAPHLSTVDAYYNYLNYYYPCLNTEQIELMSLSSFNIPHMEQGSGNVSSWSVPLGGSDVDNVSVDVYRRNDVESNIDSTEPDPYFLGRNMTRRVSVGYCPFSMKASILEDSSNNNAETGLYSSSTGTEYGSRRVSILSADININSSSIAQEKRMKETVDIAAMDTSSSLKMHHPSLKDRINGMEIMEQEQSNMSTSKDNTTNRRNMIQGNRAIGNPSNPTERRRHSFDKSMFGAELSIERRVSSIGFDALVDEVELDNDNAMFRNSQHIHEEANIFDNLLSSALRLKIPSRRTSDSSFSIPFINFDDDCGD